MLLFLIIMIIFLFIYYMAFPESKGYNVPYYKNGQFISKNNSRFIWLYHFFIFMVCRKKWPDKVSLKNDIIIPDKHSKDLKIYFINHSSFLIQIDNLNILTDPVFSYRISPVSFLGSRRVILPGIKKQNLPKIDFILISRSHYDHLDAAFIRWICNRDNPKIFTGLGVGDILQTDNYKELKWWEETKFKNISITFTPAQHCSQRRLFSINKDLWGSFVIKNKDTILYFAGDSGYGPHFKEIRNKFKKIDISFLPIGGHMADRHINYIHMCPEDALRAHNDLGSLYSLGMHWGTFQLSCEHRMEPKYAIENLASQKNISTFFVPENGDSYNYKNNILMPVI